MSKSMKLHLRGAFTVAAPKKRLRMWVGVPIMIGASAGSLTFKSKVKELVANDRPYAAAALQNAIPAVVGAALTAYPYTRWAGALVLGWSVLGAAVSSYTFGTEAGKQAMSMAGAQGVRILRG